MTYNGGSCVAMVGKDCVAIASDLRFGQQAMTLSMDFPKTFQMTPKLYVGLTGLGTDVQTLSALFKYKVNMYALEEERVMSPKTFAHMVSSTLYERRFGPYYAEPCIAGLDKDNHPFIASTDLIGCINFAKDFVVSGSASSNLYGMCESLWEPNLVSDAFWLMVDILGTGGFV
jgi:20S proteasome subunit beta 3